MVIGGARPEPDGRIGGGSRRLGSHGRPMIDPTGPAVSLLPAGSTYTLGPMPFRLRLAAPVSVLLVTSLLAACGALPSPTASSGDPVATPAASVDIAARDAYNAAICPIFTGILEIEPRLTALRRAGAAGGDMSGHATEIDAASAGLKVLLDDLEAVPEWSEGANLRFLLITALHAIRSRVLSIGEDPGAGTAAEALASLPFISSDAMDVAMQTAVSGGLNCEGAS